MATKKATKRTTKRATKKVATKKTVARKAPAKKAATKKAPAPATPKTGTYADMEAKHRGKSEVESPVNTAWNIFSESPELRRKDAIAKAVDAGVSYYTARTQYQLWLTAYRNSN